MRALLLLLISATTAFAGLGRYSDLVVSDTSKPSKSGSVRITYLGTNGYQLEAAGHSILIDPYFSRISLPRIALGWPVHPESGRINEGMKHVDPNVDAIIVTHAHFDHLLDAPALMQRTGARLIGSSTAVELAARAGGSRNRCSAVHPGSVRTVGPWRITTLPASHDRLFLMGVPYNRTLKEVARPGRAADWVCGEPLSYRIVVNGITIFIDSGGSPGVLPSRDLGPVDLAILGMALPDSRARFAETVRRLNPRFILASHQDNFFVPLDRGFHFGTLTDFGFVRAAHAKQHLPGRLILLDYFRPWTLPRS
jgi:L-ascorbate metabolism protein UlaG (beta-lactamase superfamily)